MKLLLCSALSFWLFSTIFIDIYLIPTVFRTLDDVMVAGGLGLKVFSFYNKIEVILGVVAIVACLKLQYKKRFFLSMILLGFAISYLAYLSPKISELTALLVSGGQEIQAQHEFYHSLYVKLDSAKMIILLVFWGSLFLPEKNKNKGLIL